MMIKALIKEGRYFDCIDFFEGHPEILNQADSFWIMSGKAWFRLMTLPRASSVYYKCKPPNSRLIPPPKNSFPVPFQFCLNIFLHQY
jgi:hypothetical protein